MPPSGHGAKLPARCRRPTRKRPLPTPRTPIPPSVERRPLRRFSESIPDGAVRIPIFARRWRRRARRLCGWAAPLRLNRSRHNNHSAAGNSVCRKFVKTELPSVAGMETDAQARIEGRVLPVRRAVDPPGLMLRPSADTWRPSTGSAGPSRSAPSPKSPSTIGRPGQELSCDPVEDVIEPILIRPSDRLANHALDREIRQNRRLG